MGEMRKSILLKEMKEDAGSIKIEDFKKTMHSYAQRLQAKFKPLLVAKVISHAVQCG